MNLVSMPAECLDLAVMNLKDMLVVGLTMGLSTVYLAVKLATVVEKICRTIYGKTYDC